MGKKQKAGTGGGEEKSVVKKPGQGKFVHGLRHLGMRTRRKQVYHK